MEHLDGILKLTENELDSIVKNGKYRSREEIDSVYKLIDIAKDAICIQRWEEDGLDDMSYDRNPGYARDDGSYARGRRMARRDNMGRYSRSGYDDDRQMSLRGYYNEGRALRGYSRGSEKDEYKEQLRALMEDAPDEQTRQGIKRMIDAMQ